VTSELLRLLPTGEPAPANAPALKPSVESRAADFNVSDIRVSQGWNSADYFLTFTVKNVSHHRATGQGCMRAYGYGHDDPPQLEEVPTRRFNLAPGASETVSETFFFDNDNHWDVVTTLRVFASPWGCSDAEDSRNVGFPFPKPAGIREPQGDSESPDPESH
jgi:hypothetical protein